MYNKNNESSNFIKEIIAICKSIPEIVNAKLVIYNKDVGKLSFDI